MSHLPPSHPTIACEPPHALLVELRASARRYETPCGDGTLVWHCWGLPDTHSDARSPHAPCVLLHGGSGSWTHWARNIQALVQAGRPVLVPDLPGFGDSARPGSGRDADALVAPLEAGLQDLLAQAGRHQPGGGDSGDLPNLPIACKDVPIACDLVGFSFGGMVAGFWAQTVPARAQRLVLVGAPGLGVAARDTVPLTAWRHLRDEAAMDAVHQHNIAALMLYRPQASSSDIRALALQIHRANVNRDRLPGRRLAYTDALRQTLAQIRCPVFAIYGQEDALYRGQLDALRTALNDAPTLQGLTLIAQAGHWVQFEQAAHFDVALATVLDAVVLA